MDQDNEVARMLQNTQIGDINDRSVFDIYGSEDIDNLKPVKIYDVNSSTKIDSNNHHGLKKIHLYVMEKKSLLKEIA